MQHLSPNEIKRNITALYSKGEGMDLQKAEQIVGDYFEKGGKAAMIGEKRTFGGREYIKTAGGWKFHGKGSGAKEHASAHAKGVLEDVTSKVKPSDIKVNGKAIPELPSKASQYPNKDYKPESKEQLEKDVKAYHAKATLLGQRNQLKSAMEKYFPERSDDESSDISQQAFKMLGDIYVNNSKDKIFNKDAVRKIEEMLDGRIKFDVNYTKNILGDYLANRGKSLKREAIESLYDKL